MIWIPIAGSIFYLFMYLSSWWTLKIQGIGSRDNYGDLKSVVVAAGCYRDIGERIFSVGGECSYGYGRTLLNLINFSHLAQINIAIVGASAMVALLACFLYLIFIASPKSFTSQIQIFLMSISPCFWILFKSGNFDWLVFILIFLGVLTLRTRLEILGVILIGISGPLKFYSLPLLLLIPFIMKNRLSRLASMVTFIALLPMTLTDISLIKTFPNPVFAAFGSPALGLWANIFSRQFNLGFKLSDFNAHILGLIIFVSALSLVLYSNHLRSRHGLLLHSRDYSKVESLYIVFSGTYLICYLVGMNYDYRLIFLVASLILCSRVNPKLFSNRLFQIIAQSSLWLTFFYFGIPGAINALAVLGNIAQGLMAVIIAYQIINYLDLFHPLSLLKNLTKVHANS